jgi:hypothetical protein
MRQPSGFLFSLFVFVTNRKCISVVYPKQEREQMKGEVSAAAQLPCVSERRCGRIWRRKKKPERARWPHRKRSASEALDEKRGLAHAFIQPSPSFFIFTS